MMLEKFKKAVPPVELCAKIPEGEFKDSIFSWVHSTVYMPPDGQGTDVLFVTWSHRDDFCLRRICPAPTLDEILEVLPKDDAYNDLVINFSTHTKFGGWHVHYPGDRERHFYDKRAVVAAMKLYLKLKGKCNGQV